MSQRPTQLACGWAVAALAALVGCTPDMADQPRYEPLEGSRFFPDERSSRHLPEGTIARGRLVASPSFTTGKQDGQLLASIPLTIDTELLDRGRRRFDIFCSPCHGSAGYGDGVIVQRGFPPPPSFHIDRLRQAPPGHFFSVITEGFGKMFSHSSRIEVSDRWAIIAYIRALQLSQDGRLDDVPANQQNLLEPGR